MSRPRIFFFTGAWCVGIICAEFFSRPLEAAVLGVGGIGALHWRAGRLPGMLLITLVSGWIYALHTWPPPSPLIGPAAQSISGTVVGATPKGILMADLAGRGPVRGNVEVMTDEWYRPGTILRVTCRWDAYSQPQRLRQAAHRRVARCLRVESIQDLGAGPGRRATLARVQYAITEKIHARIREPQASLLIGILLGDDSGMSKELQEEFRRTGTTHIIALSGFNITIIVTTVMAALASILGRRHATPVALVLVALFVVMTGASASVTRAAMMASVVHAVLWAGRPISAGRVLSYAIIGMTIQNPLLLRHDLGFQLSVLSTLGLMTLSKPLEAWLRWVTERGGIRETLAATLAALLSTQPLLLGTFGTLSLIAPLVNVVVVPFVPIAMAAGSVMLGLDVVDVGVLAAPATDGVLRLILASISFGAALPWSQTTLSIVPAALAASASAFLALRIPHYAKPSPHP